jgi:SAM-dependent MidA family methyltransferase
MGIENDEKRKPKHMIPFSEYMAEWLYGPEGYYANFKAIGKQGDFYTAVSASRFFGATISHYMISLIKAGRLSPRTKLVEIGAHQGYLLADMIEWIAQEAPELLETMGFGIVEPFAPMRQAQLDYFVSRFGEVIVPEHYEDPRQVGGEEIFFVANEIFDAFPCDLVYKGKTALADRSSHEVLFEGDDEQALELARRYGRERGEVARGYEAFAASMAEAGERILFVTFDYGEKEPRTDFSLRIYKGHEVFPFFEEGLDRAALFGKSDLTYDVHFDHLIDAYETAGFKTAGYKTQLRALTEMGLPHLLEQLAKLGDQALYLRELGKIKTLIDPQMMGERFKMVEFHKNIG